MIRMLLELGYHKNYDINRALLEAVQCKSNTVHDDGHDEATRSEIISLLIDAGANPHSAVAITQFPDKHLVHGFRGSKSVKEKARKGVTPLALAAHCEDVDAVRTMLNSFSLSLSSLRSSRRCDPLLRMQPETYFQTLESREDDAIDSSLQVRGTHRC
jgi:ankyrin repeat protein